MDSDLQKLAADLAALKPARLDDELLDRLCVAAGDGPAVAGESLRALESSLGGLRPAPLSDGLLDRLVAQVGHVPFSKDEKVVMFPGRPSSGDEARGGSRKGWMAAAAAVALAGAISAFLYTPGETSAPVAATPAETRAPAPQQTADAGAFAPASFGSDLSDTSDLGLVWSKDRRPMRLMRVVFADRVNFKNDRGETVVMEVPRVEYLAVPEKID